MGTLAGGSHVAKVQAHDLGYSQPATCRESEDNEVLAAVGGSSPPTAKIVQHGRIFGTRQNPGWMTGFWLSWLVPS